MQIEDYFVPCSSIIHAHVICETSFFPVHPVLQIPQTFPHTADNNDLLHAENLKKQHNRRLFHTGFISSPNEVEKIRSRVNAWMYP
jgi:hypothetical protein